MERNLRMGKRAENLHLNLVRACEERELSVWPRITCNGGLTVVSAGRPSFVAPSTEHSIRNIVRCCAASLGGTAGFLSTTTVARWPEQHGKVNVSDGTQNDSGYVRTVLSAGRTASKTACHDNTKTRGCGGPKLSCAGRRLENEARESAEAWVCGLLVHMAQRQDCSSAPIRCELPTQLGAGTKPGGCQGCSSTGHQLVTKGRKQCHDAATTQLGRRIGRVLRRMSGGNCRSPLHTHSRVMPNLLRPPSLPCHSLLS